MANFEGVVFLAAFGALDAGAVTGLKAQQGLQACIQVVGDRIDQPPVQRLRCGDGFARQAHLRQCAPRQQMMEYAQDLRREQADLHLGQAEFCSLACDNDVGAQGELKPATKRKSFNCSNQWLWTLHDRAPVFLHIS